MRKLLFLLASLPLLTSPLLSKAEQSVQAEAPAPAAAIESQPAAKPPAPLRGGVDYEVRANRAYLAAVKGGPLTLRAFLAEFPKGADLHMHLSGAVYAESFLREAGEDGVCVDPAALSFAKPPCTAPLLEAASVPSQQELYDRLINAFSMRNFVPTQGYSGHDHFFATFARFGGLKNHYAEWVDETASRAAAQNQQYLELMTTPPFGHAAGLAAQLKEKITPGFTEKEFAQLRQSLLDHGLREEVQAGLDEIRAADEGRAKLERCGQKEATPACRVEARYIYQVLRAFSPEQVFAQTLLGFETVSESQRLARSGKGRGGFVGLNFVQPEDSYIPMRDYSLQMRMLGYLHSVYPEVHISLHAGELAPGMVPPEGLRSHIREAVEIAHAERIGHGVDVMYESGANELLAQMARKHILVEINLSSNEGILGLSGAQHPFPVYRAAHVPVALSTDDEGVSRIDITTEYVRAARDYNLSYRELKTLARAGMEHSFLAGEGLWSAPDAYVYTVDACRADLPGSLQPSAACGVYLEKNEKARAQWELEQRLREFENRF